MPPTNPPAIVVMVKAPRPGTVKTRLASLLSGEDASRFAACCAQDVVRAARELTPSVLIAYAPADGQPDLEALLGSDGLAWAAQEGADLGARMHHAASAAQSALRVGPVVLLGTDSPTFPPDAVTRAFALLETHDVILGPADDGGYWCVGLRQPFPGLFDGITWSTDAVFAQTVANARQRGLHVATVTPWYDVDTPADLERLRHDPALPTRAPATSAWFSERAERPRTIV